MAREDRLRADGDPVAMADLLDQLEHLRETVDEEPERREVAAAVSMAERLSPGVFGERIRKYTGRDVAEAFVGSIVFAVPLLVEDGVFAIARHLLSVRAVGLPVALLANAAFTVLVATALIYWADIQRVSVAGSLLGVPVPRRLVGVLAVSFLTAAATMTLWGRVGWADPAVGLARVSVVWTVAAIGAALGDILPGESAGADLASLVSAELRALVD